MKSLDFVSNKQAQTETQPGVKTLPLSVLHPRKIYPIMPVLLEHHINLINQFIYLKSLGEWGRGCLGEWRWEQRGGTRTSPGSDVSFVKDEQTSPAHSFVPSRPSSLFLFISHLYLIFYFHDVGWRGPCSARCWKGRFVEIDNVYDIRFITFVPSCGF